MKNYGKIFKYLMWGLIVVSVILLVFGFIAGFENNDGNAVDILLYWAYAMIAVAIVAAIVIGAWIGAKNNPKSLVKLGIGLVAVVVVCLAVYFLSPGKPAMGMLEQPSAQTLKLTDTLLNLTYICFALAIIAIIAGEILASVRNKK